MSDTDLILRAVSDGNPACPDGPALARLGALVRRHSELSAQVEIVSQVRERLRGDAVHIQEHAAAPAAVSDDEIDAVWEDNGEQAADLARLRQMVGALAPPDPVDLRAAVRARLAEADHRGTALQLPPSSRWRLISSVILSHFAAVLAIAVFYGALRDQRPDADASAPEVTAKKPSPLPSGSDQSGAVPAGPLVLDHPLPARWSDIRALGLDIYALRRDQRLRAMAGDHYRTASARPCVAEGLAWLAGQQRADGVVGDLSGDAARDLATQGFAALAFLGEGEDDPARAAHAHASLAWIAARLDAATEADRGQVATAIAVLALVEGAGLGENPGLREQAERAIPLLDGGVPPEPGVGGLGGFTLLALEVAEQGGLRVPERLLEGARQRLARTAPQADDCGALGLAAFAREVYGQRSTAGATREIAELGRMLPARASDGTVDPLAWFFATLAMREVGGEAWATWSQSLQAALLPAFQYVPVGSCRVPGSAARHASGRGGDVFATSLAIIDLQAAYRYLPVDRLAR